MFLLACVYLRYFHARAPPPPLFGQAGEKRRKVMPNGNKIGTPNIGVDPTLWKPKANKEPINVMRHIWRKCDWHRHVLAVGTNKGKCLENITEAKLTVWLGIKNSMSRRTSPKNKEQGIIFHVTMYKRKNIKILLHGNTQWRKKPIFRTWLSS